MIVDVERARDATSDGTRSGRPADDLIVSRRAAIDEHTFLVQLKACETHAVGCASLKSRDYPPVACRTIDLRADVAVRNIVLLGATTSGCRVGHGPMGACGIDGLVVFLAALVLRRIVAVSPVLIAKPQ